MKDWESNCDAMILFANKSVLDFYPKFGFNKEIQYSFRKKIDGNTSGETIQTHQSIHKLNMNSQYDLEKLKAYYSKTNPFSKLQAIKNYSLLMFYCSSPMKDFIYYSPQYDAIVIAKQDHSTFHCFDIYCDKGKDLMEILLSVAAVETKTINLEFTPIDNPCFNSICFDSSPIYDNDNTLFVLNNKDNIFRSEQLLFPELSHT